MRYIARYNGVAYVVTDTSIPWDITAHMTMEQAQEVAARKNGEEGCEPTSK